MPRTDLHRAAGRRWLDLSFRVATGACASLAMAATLGIVAILLWRGLPALDVSFVLAATRRAGAAGGILYQLLGTLVLVATALAFCLPLSVALALVEGVYLRDRCRARRLLRLGLNTASGVPSILFGIFGLMLFVKLFGWGKSWLAGGILLGLMAVPTAAVALAERIEALPRKYLQAAYGLGLRRSQVVWSVILPQSVPGLISGVLLGLARAAGETAPILFTAAVFSGVTLPSGVRESPVLALPYHIFVLAQDSFDPATRPRLWAAAFVLLTVVIGLSLLALPARLTLARRPRS